MAKAAKPYSGASSSLTDFKQLCLLGEGAYSAVYKVLRLADRELYALKKVKLPSLSDKEKQNALNEVRLLASIRHENIIAYKEAFFDDKTRCLCIVTEYADSGDLFQAITKSQKGRTHIPETDVWRYIHGMCHGLKALHDMRILHRDLKCANVFLNTLDNQVIAKLGDFNVSKVAKRGLCMTQTGTPYYASPEVWRDMPYDAKSDMWSIGCVLYEMVALRPPFRAEDMEGLYRKVLRGQYPRIPPHYSHDLSEVIGVLLQVNPRHRPSVDQLIQMPVMKRHSPDNVPESRITDLLSTIKMPKNAIDITACLPKPQYDLDFGAYLEQAVAVPQVPPSQESGGDVAGGTGPGTGTRQRRAMPPLGGRGNSLGQLSQPALPQLPPPPSDAGGPESYQDSLDAYIGPEQQGNISQIGAATTDVPVRLPPVPNGRDSLDDILISPQKNRSPPAHPIRQIQQPVHSVAEEPQERENPIIAAADLRQSANPRGLRALARQEAQYQTPARQQQVEYMGAPSNRGEYGGRAAAQPQYQAYPGLPAPVPRYGGEYSNDDPRVRASPAPSSQHGHAPASHHGRAPSHTGSHAGSHAGMYGGKEQYRHPPRVRPAMASYARPQYAMGSAAAMPQQQQRQQSGGSGLRLPRIFTKG